MKVCLIDQKGLPFFRSLLLPSVVMEAEAENTVLALGVTEESEGETIACGAVAGWVAEETFEIHSLYVAPAYRRQGGGRLLIETICKLAQAYCRSIEVSFTVTEKAEHETLLPFLENMGFHETDVMDKIYGISLCELENSSFFAGAKSGKAPNTVPFSEAPRSGLTQAYKDAAVRGENYLPYSLTDVSVDADISMAAVDGSRVRSFVAFVPQSAEVLSLAWAYSGNAADLPVLFRTAFVRAKEKYPAETLLTVQAVHPAAERLVTTLLPQAKVISHTFVRELEEE